MAAHFVAETDDSIETREWLDSVDALVAMHCVQRARQVLGRAYERARRTGVDVGSQLTIDYETDPKSLNPCAV